VSCDGLICILHQLEGCLPFSLLQSDITLIISDICLSRWHCLLNLSNFDIFDVNKVIYEIRR
jgi:hypothetical protein